MNFKKSKEKSEIKVNKKLTRDKKKYSKQHGITLIVLVVTIAVLLILAGVSITAVLKDDGITDKAKEAQNKINKATEDEHKDVNELRNWLNNHVGETTNETDETVTTTTISFTVDGTTYQAKEGMTWKQAFEAGYFDNKEQTDKWYEMYGTAEKQKNANGKYVYSTHMNPTDEYIVTDAKAYNIMVCNNRLYNGGTQYFKADGSLYNYFGSVFLYIIPEGATKDTSSQVMPDDVITTNGKYIIYNDL